ncbi:MAG: glycosyltransferase family 4 protein [Phycisphaerae bacterium]|nr:glycosyltransferase family 4 protein [Phycisphaerae bacterium]
MEKERKEKVILFYRYLPHYRLGLYELLYNSPKFDYSFFVGQKGGEKKEETLHLPDETPFPVQYRRMWSFQPLKKKNPMYFQPGEIAAALGRKYNVLILNADYHVVSYLLASILGRLCGKKIIHWGHAVPRKGPEKEGSFRWWFRKLANRLAHAFLLYGNREYNLYAERGVDMKRYFPVNNALDTRPVQALIDALSPQELETFQKEKGLFGRRVLIYTGRLIKEKQVDLGVAAMPRILAKIPNATLLLIGDGPEMDNLKAQARQLQVEDAVIFAGGVYDDATLTKYYLSSEVAVSPGYIGLMINHAFMYGLPALTHDNYWIHAPEVIMLQPGETGAFFKENNAEDLADKAIELLGNPEKLAKMRDNCRRLIATEYNERYMADRFDKAVEYALDH